MSKNWLTRLKGNVAKGLKTVEAVNDAVVAVRRAKKNKKSTPAKDKATNTTKPSWMGQDSQDGKGDTRKSTAAPKKPIVQK